MTTDNRALVPITPAPLTGLPPVEGDEGAIDYVNRVMELLSPPEGDAAERIVAGLLTAPTGPEENKLWDATGSKNAMGKRFIFHRVFIQPSDFEEARLDFYLVCSVTDCETGERGILTTGSLNIVTSLVKAQLLGNLPWEAEIIGPKRVPRSGHVPLRLRWVAKIVDADDD